MSSWYLIYSKPQQERTALINLERQGYVVYLPMCHQRSRQLPLFPRYLFIYLNTDSDNWSPIRSTRGVANLVRFGGVAAKVPDDFIQYLKAHEMEWMDTEASPLQSGDLVEITDGVLASYSGVFQEALGAKRAAILLHIADRYTTVRVSVGSVRKVD